MVDRHYDDEALISFLQSASCSAQSDPHLLTCTGCSETLRTLRSLAGAMTDESVWQPPIDSTPNPQTIATLRAFADNMTREDAEAEALLPALVADHRLAAFAEYQTAGIVRQLLATADRAIDTMPPDAVRLTALATTIADALDEARYESDAVAKLRGAAWRDYAYALYYTGSFAEAEKAVFRAESHFSDCVVSEYDAARVALLDAMVSRALEHLDRATPLTREAAEAFRRFGDEQRSNAAESVHASLLFAEQKFDSALAAWRRLISTTDDDALAYARNLSNIATCERHLGATDAALRNYATAAALFTDAGSVTHALRVEWNIASTLASAGRIDDALSKLKQLRAQFDGLGMASEAALIALDVAELLLAKGRVAEIPELCATAMASFNRSGIPYGPKAQTAIAFIREASVLGRVTPVAIRQVRTYLRDLPQQPQLLFAAPPE
ncbi:MAG TPA: hypothetical protein VF111_09375 [Thermoanaerobaculia bacterium]